MIPPRAVDKSLYQDEPAETSCHPRRSPAAPATSPMTALRQGDVARPACPLIGPGDASTIVLLESARDIAPGALTAKGLAIFPPYPTTTRAHTAETASWLVRGKEARLPVGKGGLSWGISVEHTCSKWQVDCCSRCVPRRWAGGISWCTFFRGSGNPRCAVRPDTRGPAVCCSLDTLCCYSLTRRSCPRPPLATREHPFKLYKRPFTGTLLVLPLLLSSLEPCPSLSPSLSPSFPL